MKKVSALIMGAVTALNLAVCPVVFADGGGAKPYGIGIGIGDYIQFGKYNDEPILWRYVADDENGMLILSDKVLCEKPFEGTLHKKDIDNDRHKDSYFIIDNYWSDSFIRQWLNSDVSEDEVDWAEKIGKPSLFQNCYHLDPYEKGFLHNSNFSLKEQNAIQTISQWTMLPSSFEEYGENGVYSSYYPVKGYKNVEHGNVKSYFYDFCEVKEHYRGAAYRETDKIFLPDEMQMYKIMENIGDIKAMGIKALQLKPEWNDYFYSYYLRTPFLDDKICCIDGSGRYCFKEDNSACGIRPAFYLNEKNAEILSGSGTEDDPYIMTGKSAENEEHCPETNIEGSSHISVTCDNKQVVPAYKIHIQNDRIFVHIDDFGEMLGTTFKYDYFDNYTITDGKESFQIEMNETNAVRLNPNSYYIHDGERIKLDVAPRYLALNVYVPLRAFSELFGAKVEWVEDEQKVVITTR